MQYDENKHILLHDRAHKARLTPEEYPAYEQQLISRGIEVLTVECPEWPPVEKSRLMLIMGGDDPWEGQYWQGSQPAVDASDYLARRTVTKTARAMAGPGLAPKRLAYAWQVPEYDPAQHILMRQWLADNEVWIVDFLRKYVPKIEKDLSRDLLFEVANPYAQAESDAGGGYSPTRRALAVEDLPILEKFGQTSERFTYEASQPVRWVRALDDSRWEARRQHEPQRSRWQNHRSWINRTIGDGAWTEEDRGPEGHAFGPFMELWDSGAIYLWCYKRALGFLEQNALIINGVPVSFSPEKIGIVCRMVGHVDDVAAILAGAVREPAAESVSAVPLTVDCDFRRRGNTPFWHPTDARNLPGAFHRSSGDPLVFRERGAAGEIRAWGDQSLLGGFVLNGILLTGFAPWRSTRQAPIGSWSAKNFRRGRLLSPATAPSRLRPAT